MRRVDLRTRKRSVVPRGRGMLNAKHEMSGDVWIGKSLELHSPHLLRPPCPPCPLSPPHPLPFLRPSPRPAAIRSASQMAFKFETINEAQSYL